MLSLADILRWLGGKAFTALLLFIALVAFAALWTYVPDWWQGFKGAAARAGETRQKLGELADAEALFSRAEADLREAEGNGPNPWLHPIKGWQHRQKTAAKRKALDAARASRDRLQLEVDRLKMATTGALDRVYDALARWWPTFAWIIGAVILAPPGWRCIAFFILAPLAGRAPPIQLTSASEPGGATPAQPARSFELEIPHGETLYVRPGCLQGRRGVATGSTLARFPLAPLITSAAKLFGLTWVRAENAGQPATVTLSTEEPDVYFTVLELQDHPGFVLHPRHIVGLSHGIGIHARWKPWRLHALLTGQIRYILFHGTGRLVLRGTGGVRADPGSAYRSKIEERAVVGFDSRATFSTTRTEEWMGYVFGSVPLMDDQFAGPFFFLREVSPGIRPRNMIHRTFGAVFSAVGKFFGF